MPVRLGRKKIDRMIIHYSTLDENEIKAMQHLATGAKILGYRYTEQYHLKDDVMHYTGEAVYIMERELAE